MTKNIKQIQWSSWQETQVNSKYYAFVISKPKRFGWLRRLFRLSDCYVETIFSNSENPTLPKGFTKYKLIGEVKND